MKITVNGVVIPLEDPALGLEMVIENSVREVLGPVRIYLSYPLVIRGNEQYHHGVYIANRDAQPIIVDGTVQIDTIDVNTTTITLQGKDSGHKLW